MAKYLLFFLFLGCLGSCANVDELIENGQYDHAIHKGIQKLEKTPNDAVAQKNVIKAYQLAQKMDLADLRSFYELEESPATWEMIYNTYAKMKDRDRQLENANLSAPLAYHVPSGEMQNAQKNLCIAYTDLAEELMEKQTKIGYRQAYSKWQKTRQYNCEIDQLDSLISYCVSKGKVSVALQLDEQKGVSIPEKTRIDLSNLSFSRNNKLGMWVDYWTNYEIDQEINYTVLCTFNEITVSRNRESVVSTVAEKKIIDHYENKKNAEGKIERVPVYKIIKATIKKYTQRKASTQGVYFLIIDNEKGSTLYQKQLVARFSYVYNYSTASGDLRALSSKQKNALKRKKKPFPSNSFMVQRSGEKLVNLVSNEIYRQRRFFN